MSNMLGCAALGRVGMPNTTADWFTVVSFYIQLRLIYYPMKLNPPSIEITFIIIMLAMPAGDKKDSPSREEDCLPSQDPALLFKITSHRSQSNAARKTSRRKECNDQKQAMLQIFKDLISTVNQHFAQTISPPKPKPQKNLQNAKPRPRVKTQKIGEGRRRQQQELTPQFPRKSSVQNEQEMLAAQEAKQAIFRNYSVLMSYRIMEQPM